MFGLFGSLFTTKEQTVVPFLISLRLYLFYLPLMKPPLQEEYVDYMKAHKYGEPPLDVEETGDAEMLKMYKSPAAHKPSLACDAHEAGLVSVRDDSRHFCFGAALLPGKRVCDVKIADYTTLHDTYAAKPFFCLVSVGPMMVDFASGFFAVVVVHLTNVF